MGKTYKVVVLGGKGTGKTALLEQAIYGTHTVGTVSMLDPVQGFFNASAPTNFS